MKNVSRQMLSSFPRIHMCSSCSKSCYLSLVKNLVVAQSIVQGSGISGQGHNLSSQILLT